MMSAEEEVRELYQRLIDAWNRRSATDMAALFHDEGASIGFDGSQMLGPAAIESELARIFAEHPTAPYTVKVKAGLLLSSEVALLRAIAGMVPQGKEELDPKLNAIQTLVARKEDGWRVILFQNTPAQFHGRPELVQQMTDELREIAGTN
jgi:uncharacterized protein (TIGR02246 family)